MGAPLRPAAGLISPQTILIARCSFKRPPFNSLPSNYSASSESLGDGISRVEMRGRGNQTANQSRR